MTECSSGTLGASTCQNAKLPGDLEESSAGTLGASTCQSAKLPG
eukprot:CAMPEP_0197891410 /NCGR_PEP_ID=MMETSP1439-20131203/28455_1 /TAXON_ID=66791 /ORGANISM="Gonyaulax spinifera, Strain CCMP409" /LENGTH=43 /DNA_ID= /DNA_START= /DNA_END= /DNA_ORIENTATION=